MSVGPVFRTMREQIADRIREDVLSGRLEEGASLREVTLAKHFGVSRAPIRDALLQLTQEGLLEAKPNCGVKVGVAPSEHLQPLIVRLRRELELSALELAFQDFTEADFDLLDKSVEQLHKACKAEDLAQIVKHDMEFHRHLLEAAGSSDLVAMWLPIVSRMLLHYSRHADILESYREHEQIATAIRARDRKAAIEALAKNIQ